MALRYTAEQAYICSIYPGEVEPQRRNYGPTRESNGKGAVRSTLFALQPVVRGSKPGYVVLELSDCFEDIIELSQLSVGNTKGKVPKPVNVEQIVADLIAVWTGGLVGVPQGAKPGIMQIANSTPQQKELVVMRDQQTQYFEYLFNEGERLDSEKDWKNITAPMRLAATWLERPRRWSHNALAAGSSPCPLCTKVIPGEAVVCPECTNQISFADGNGGIVRFTAGQIIAQNAAAIKAPPHKGA